MSASREKKTRQDLTASGYVDPKATRKEEARKAERRSRIGYACVAVAFVLVAAFVLIWNAGIIQRNATAYTVDGQDFTAADVDYYAYTVYNNYYSMYGNYTSYFLTAESLRDATLAQIRSTVALANAAKADGYAIEGDLLAKVNDAMDGLSAQASANGYSSKQYLKAVFGSLMNEDTVRRNIELTTLATAYSSDYEDSVVFSDDELLSEYNSSPADYDSADIEYVLFKTDLASDADEDTAAAAMEEVKEKADAALARYAVGESLSSLADELGGAYTRSAFASNGSTDMLNWVFDDARRAEDSAAVAHSDNGGYYAVVFHSRSQNTYHTVNVRHILISIDDTTDAAAALEKAEALQSDFLANGASEEYFAELANANSSDSAEGGLYTSIRRGQMVPEFDAWCFEGHESGDTGIVFDSTYNGYHLIYFVGENDEPCWKEQTRTALTDAAVSEWFSGITATVEGVESSGMKYTSKIL